MTSFIIKAHEGRVIPEEWTTKEGCPFCHIIRGEGPAFKVYEDDRVIAVLGPFISCSRPRLCAHIFPSRDRVLQDILPLRPGHTLVIPKAHYARVSELPPEYAAAVGAAVSKVSHAMTEGV